MVIDTAQRGTHRFNDHFTGEPGFAMYFALTTTTITTPQPFYGPFSGTTRVSRCQKRTSGLYGARGD